MGARGEPVAVVGVAVGVVWVGSQVATVVEGVCCIVVWLMELAGVNIVGVTVISELDDIWDVGVAKVFGMRG